MKKLLFFVVAGLSFFEGLAMAPTQQIAPEVLYKILSLENWKSSSGQDRLLTPPSDNSFIHFSTEKQYQKVIDEKFKNTHYAVLTVEVAKLVGELKLEPNNARTEQFYHLYDGHIPMKAIMHAVVPAFTKAPF